MQVLVFGQTGQVACELALFDGVTNLSRADADLSNPSACADVIRRIAPDAVINAAAYTAVDRCEEEEVLATVINGEAPVAMAQACAELDIPFVHISTDYVFAGDGEASFKSSDPVAPLNAYGRSKLFGETGIAQVGGRYCVLRTSWVVSAHGNNFIKTMLRLSETRDALTVVADQIGGPTSAAEIAKACMTITTQLIEQGREKSGVYHFSGAPDTSWAEFARNIFTLSNRAVNVTDIPTSDYPTPAKRPLNSRMDCSQLTLTYGIERPDWRQNLVTILGELGVSTQDQTTERE
jgi:dTDP-4-dehydrorhamnose reductase